MNFKTIIPVLAMAMTTTVSAQTIGIRLENMDQTVKPGTDFFKFFSIFY